MEVITFLLQIKQCFSHVPESDNRAKKIGPRDFVVALILALSAYSETRTLESIRQQVLPESGIALARSTFWERLSTKRLLGFLREAFKKWSMVNAHKRRWALSHTNAVECAYSNTFFAQNLLDVTNNTT